VLEISEQHIHMGFILDGNRRYAKKLMMEPWKGHEFGLEALEKLLSWAKERSITEVTIYAFSIQNFNRPKHEFEYLMNLFKKAFKKMNDDPEDKVNKNRVRIRFLGRLDLFPKEIQVLCREVESKTKDYDGYRLNICFGYGGREEIVDAVYQIARDVKDGKLLPTQVDEDLIDSYVYNSSKPDFIIRTGGDFRTSNFLPWQSVYSEWFFLDKFFPEITENDLDSVLEDFKQRERRFGK